MYPWRCFSYLNDRLVLLPFLQKKNVLPDILQLKLNHPRCCSKMLNKEPALKILLNTLTKFKIYARVLGIILMELRRLSIPE
jgi:hypothetical protein